MGPLLTVDARRAEQTLSSEDLTDPDLDGQPFELHLDFWWLREHALSLARSESYPGPICRSLICQLDFDVWAQRA